jgi:hypothetical protein
MRSLVFLLVTVILSLSLIFPQTCLASDDPKSVSLPGDVEKEIGDILTAMSAHQGTDGYQVAKAYRTLFKKVGPDGIRELQAHSNDAIAIQAAWQQVALTIPEKEPRENVRPDADKLYWFLGFLEGRARAKAPKWWSQALLGMMANGRHSIYSGLPKKDLYHKLGLDETRGPQNTHLKREGDKVVLWIDKQSASIPDDLLSKTDDGKVYCNVSGLMTPTRCFLAVHDDFGRPYQLACMRRM